LGTKAKACLYCKVNKRPCREDGVGHISRTSSKGKGKARQVSESEAEAEETSSGEESVVEVRKGKNKIGEGATTKGRTSESRELKEFRDMLKGVVEEVVVPEIGRSERRIKKWIMEEVQEQNRVVEENMFRLRMFVMRRVLPLSNFVGDVVEAQMREAGEVMGEMSTEDEQELAESLAREIRRGRYKREKARRDGESAELAQAMEESRKDAEVERMDIDTGAGPSGLSIEEKDGEKSSEDSAEKIAELEKAESSRASSLKRSGRGNGSESDEDESGPENKKQKVD
jgi:hypothetical protein